MENYALEIPHQSLLVIGFVCVSYIFIITIFGGYFARFNNNLNDFFYSGQRFSWWLPAASMVASGIGGYSFLKYSEQGYLTGMSSSITYLNDWFTIPFFLFGWLPIIYYSKIKSIPEYFERRFNKTARFIAMIIILSYMFFYIGYNLFTAGLAIEGLFGINQIISVPLISLFLAVYVTFGGQTAVIFTDFFQGLVLLIGGIIAVAAGVIALGGIEQLWSHLPLSHRLPFVHLTENDNFNTAGLFWGEALAGSIAFAFLNQGFIMRYLTIKSVKEGRKAAFFNLLVTMPLSAIIVGGVGWIAKSLIVKQSIIGGALEGYDLLNITDTTQTFIMVCWVVIKQNPWIFGFIIAGLLAALMSTIDTLINACAAVIIYDIYQPYIRNTAPEAHYLFVARIASILSVLIGLALVVIFNIQSGHELNLMSLHYKGIMIIIPSIVTTVFMGVFWSRFHSKAACIAMLFGSAITIFSLGTLNLFHQYLGLLLGLPAANIFI
jgi:solute:Na+ symporter, SSS family